MPLIHGASKKAVSENIRREIRAGKRPDVAAAIAHRIRREVQAEQRRRK